MVKKSRYNFKPARPRPSDRATKVVTLSLELRERKVPTQYGLPFILLEDSNKNTFGYKGGAWVPHEMTIAECRVDCQVKELSQKINNMARYEIRSPLPASA